MSAAFWRRIWDAWYRLSSRPFAMSAAAIFLGLVVGAVIIIFTVAPVLDAWRGAFHTWGGIPHALKVTLDTVGAAYRQIFVGSIFDPHQLWHSLRTGKGWNTSLFPISNTLTEATPLVIVGVACGITFQTGLFNIGANGQAIIGGVAGVAVGSLIHAPMYIHLPLALLAGIAGGAIAGAIPGLLKAFTGAHEVIVTLMFNYVANFFVYYVVLSTALEQPGQQNGVSRTILRTAQLPAFAGPNSDLLVSYGVFVSLAVVAFAWWFLNRSSLGFEFRVTGANPRAARASGISARAVTVFAFLLSGALAGLAGYVYVAGNTHSINYQFLQVDTIGFTAITISLLGRNKPIGILWSALLFGALYAGGVQMSATTNVPADLATIIEYVIVMFVATPALVRNIFHLGDSGTQGIKLATAGWGS